MRDLRAWAESRGLAHFLSEALHPALRESLSARLHVGPCAAPGTHQWREKALLPLIPSVLGFLVLRSDTMTTTTPIKENT